MAKLIASVESSSIRKKRAGLPTVGIALGAGGAKHGCLYKEVKSE